MQAYTDTPGGAEVKAWLLHIGIQEGDIPPILLHFNKPEYGVSTLRELFALEDGDIDEILQALPMAKRRVLKKHIIQIGVASVVEKAVKQEAHVFRSQYVLDM